MAMGDICTRKQYFWSLDNSFILQTLILPQNPVIFLNNLANEGIQSDTILDYCTAKSSYITE